MSESEEDIWMDTPGGFCKTTIDLDDDVIEKFVTLWVNENLEPASVEQYTEMLTCNTQAESLHNAVVNDIIISVLKRHIAAEENDSK